MLALTGPSAASRQSKPKKQQRGDVMLQQWILNKTTSIPQPQLKHHSTLSSTNPSSTTHSTPHPTPPVTQEECKDQLVDQQATGVVDDDAHLLSLSRDVNYLNDEISTSDRKQALTRIHESLSTHHPLPPATLATATALLTKPLLRRLTDGAEQCRLLACGALQQVVTRCPLSRLTAALPYVLPAVSFRLNCRDLTSAAQPYSAANTHTYYPPAEGAANAEPSEEVRLQLLELTSAVVQRFNTDNCSDEFDLFLADLIAIIAQSLTDRSPPLQQSATTLLITLLATPLPSTPLYRATPRPSPHTVTHSQAQPSPHSQPARSQSAAAAGWWCGGACERVGSISRAQCDRSPCAVSWRVESELYGSIVSGQE